MKNKTIMGNTMKAGIRNDIFLLLIALIMMNFLTILFSGCTQNSENISDYSDNNSKLTVAVSILPEKEFAEAVGKDRVDVYVMIPPGSNPHTYELTSGQLKALSETEIYAMTGSQIEFELAWMDKIKSINPDMKIVDCSNGISFITADNLGVDPHIWLSPQNMKKMAENFCEGLIEVSPDDKEYFLANFQSYAGKIDEADKKIKSELSGREGETILVYHPAWSYFARDYSLNLISVESDGKEPSPAEIAEIIDMAKEKDIKVVFASPEHTTRSAEVIANAISGKVVLIDPLSENYIENLESVAKAFSEV